MKEEKDLQKNIETDEETRLSSLANKNAEEQKSDSETLLLSEPKKDENTALSPVFEPLKSLSSSQGQIEEEEAVLDELATEEFAETAEVETEQVEAEEAVEAEHEILTEQSYREQAVDAESDHELATEEFAETAEVEAEQVESEEAVEENSSFDDLSREEAVGVEKVDAEQEESEEAVETEEEIDSDQDEDSVWEVAEEEDTPQQRLYNWQVQYVPESESQTQWEATPQEPKVVADSLSPALKRNLYLLILFSILVTGVFSYNLGLKNGQSQGLLGLPNLILRESDSEQRENQSSRTDYVNEDPITTPLSVRQVSYLTADSVVEIQTERTLNDWRIGQFLSTGAGSGVVISDDGYLLSNHHVIADAETIVVVLRNGQSYEASLIGSDSKTDIALLKIEAEGLHVAVFGDSSDLVVGEVAIAIGNPLGTLGGTVTERIISTLDRAIILDGKSMNLLQTNAAINPGNSGGGLFNAYAELIGIVVAKSSGVDVEGLGFAIPINDVKEILDDLINYGYVQGRIDLKMTLKDVTGFFSIYSGYRQGIYIAKVEEDSNAEKIGLRAGDYLTAFGGRSVTSISELNSVLENYTIGDEVKVSILRNNRTYSGNLVLEGFARP